MAESERHICDAILRKADEVSIEGDRVRLKLDATGKLVSATSRRKVDKAGKDDKQQVLQFTANKFGAALQPQSDADEKEVRLGSCVTEKMKI